MSLLPSARAACLALAALSCPACLAPDPEPDDWRAYGFRSPEQTFHSFQTALAGDRPDLEYACLSQDLKEREGGNLLGYLELRDTLPWVKAAARAEIESVEPLGPDRARIVARVDWLFWNEVFTVDFVEEAFYEYWSGAERVEDGFHPFALVVKGDQALTAVPAPEEVGPEEISEVRSGREWKIDGFTRPDAEP